MLKCKKCEGSDPEFAQCRDDKSSLERWLDEGGGGEFDKELFKRLKKEKKLKEAEHKKIDS